jgi:hypothetical protein
MRSAEKPYFDVVLVQPNITWVYDPFEHLGLAYLAAMLRREGFSVKIVDAVLKKQSHRELSDELVGYDYRVLGVTLVSHGYPSVVSLLEHVCARSHGIKVVAGGHFATFAADKIMMHTRVFDAIVLGEGEYAFLNLCRHWLRRESVDLLDIRFPGQPIRRSGSRITSMDDLPFPARDNLRLALAQGAAASLTSSRGCYARCSFCTVHSFYETKGRPRWNQRSIPNVIEELHALHDEFGISHFMFVDDNFMGPGPQGRKRAMEFAAAYQRSGLPMTFHIDCRAVDVRPEVIRSLCGAGLRSIFVGIESVSTRDLILYRKGLKTDANWAAAKFIVDSGLDYTFSMIMFNPFTTRTEILDNVGFLKEFEYYPRNPLMILNLYEGTDLNETFKDYVSGPFWDYRFKFAHDETAAIYEECMRFCKTTLPLERALSSLPGGASGKRRMVHRLRLLQLEDVTQRLGMHPLDEIREFWDAQLNQTRHTLLDRPEQVAGKAGKPEREYMEGMAANVLSI